MFPRPPAVGAADYSDLYRDYLRRVDACLALRGTLGVGWHAPVSGCVGDVDFDAGADVTSACEGLGLEAQGCGGKSQGDVDGACFVSGGNLGVGAGEQGSVSSGGQETDRGGCRSIGSADAGAHQVRGSVNPRGPNYSRNARSRRAAAAKKARMMNGNWRESGSVSEYGGFFKDCDEGVQRELRESRAKLFIAQNKLRAERAEKDLAAMTSVQGIVQQMVEVTTAVAKLRKSTTDEAVRGWAKTVAGTLSKSITESSSSVPTLESVGFGVSGLRSTDGEVLDADRVEEFNKAMRAVEEHFESVDFYAEEDYKSALWDVKQRYSDIAFSKSQRDVAHEKELAARRLAEMGIGHAVIHDALYPGEDLY